MAKGKVWSSARQPRPSARRRKDDADPPGARSPFQHDYDRLLFSTPVRRLSDKTQVWPMDENDGVRTRLTHSHEVANLARSIGVRVAKAFPGQVFRGVDLHEVVQPILSSIGLAHDLGNPPFGHQGEVAIGHWFSQRKDWVFTHAGEGGEELDVPVPQALWAEFESFDGNPQSLRLITKLQTSHGFSGLDLTAATLAASLKYPVSAQNVVKGAPCIKKLGYFESERQLVDWMRGHTGLQEGQRHPLTWIMEACDDIAYSVLDTDDLLKKEIASPDDVIVALKSDPKVRNRPVTRKLVKKFEQLNDGARRNEIVRDIKINYLKAYLIEALIVDASGRYKKAYPAIAEFKHSVPLMEKNALCDALKRIAQTYAFSHRRVLKTEAVGAVAIDGLMSAFWEAICSRKNTNDLLSSRIGARARFVYSMISPNYLEAAERAASSRGPSSGMRYRELRLLTDMISGMTDTFALRVWRELGTFTDVGSSQ